MKKFTIIVAIVFASIISINANAQGKALQKENNLISATIGFGSFSFSSNISVPPISVSYERIVYEFGEKWCIGAGGFGGILTQRYSDTRIFAGTVCAQGNVHFCPTYNWDIYSGLGLGAVFASANSTNGSSTSASVGGFEWAYMLGARYFFNDKIGVNLQLGGLGICNLGISFRF